MCPGTRKRTPLPFPTILDPAGVRARRYGATLTPEAVVLDAKGALRYRGRIDSSSDTAKVRSRDLADALTAVVSGRPVAKTRTAAFGCAIQAVFSAPTAFADTGKDLITYTRDIAPILNKNCVSCHSDGPDRADAADKLQKRGGVGRADQAGHAESYHAAVAGEI
jgi:hypothetical protein